MNNLLPRYTAKICMITYHNSGALFWFILGILYSFGTFELHTKIMQAGDSAFNLTDYLVSHARRAYKDHESICKYRMYLFTYSFNPPELQQ